MGDGEKGLILVDVEIEDEIGGDCAAVDRRGIGEVEEVGGGDEGALPDSRDDVVGPKSEDVVAAELQLRAGIIGERRIIVRRKGPRKGDAGNSRTVA